MQCNYPISFFPTDENEETERYKKQRDIEFGVEIRLQNYD